MEDYNLNQTDTDKYFCFLMIRTQAAQIIGYFYLGLNIIFFAMICRQMRILWKIGLLTRVSQSFFILCTWSLFSLIQISFYQYMYNYLKNNKGTQTQTMKMKSTLSFVSFFLTFLQVFLIHTAIIRAPYNWHTNIINFMQSQSSIFDDQQQKIETRQNLSHTMDWTIRNILNWFLNIRYVILPLWVILSVVFLFWKISEQFKNHYALLLYLIVTIDALLIFIIYIIGFIAIWKNKKLKNIMESKQLKKILNKYYLVILSTLVRVIIFIIRNPQSGALKDEPSFLDSKCQNQIQLNQQIYIVIIILQALVMDFLPAITIYYIYKAPKQKKQSLIKSEIKRDSNDQLS